MTTIFHNASDAQLIDEYCDLKEQVKAMDKRLDALKQEMLKRQFGTASGTKYEIKISERKPRKPDQKALQEYLGGLWDNFLKECPYTEVRYSVKSPEIAFHHIAA